MNSQVKEILARTFRNCSAGTLELTSFERADAAPLYVTPVAVTSAEQVWLEISNRAGELGYCPVLMSNTERFRTGSHNEYPYRETIETGLNLSAQAWLRDRDKELAEDFADLELHEPWPEIELSGEKTFNLIEQASRQTLRLALLPVEHAFLIPAYLSLGGWNDCPSAEEHVAMQKHWFEHYGALMATYGDDTIEFHVERPPRSREEATKLAKEQFLYCTDIVLQGTETLDRLGAELLDSPRWFFWWD